MEFNIVITGHPMVYQCEWPLYQSHHGINPNYTAIKYKVNQTSNRGHLNSFILSEIIATSGGTTTMSRTTGTVSQVSLTSMETTRMGSWKWRVPEAGMTPTCWSSATSGCHWSSPGPRCLSGSCSRLH